MCGIYGFTRTRSEEGADRAVLDRMARVTAHRGPDDQGEYLDGRVALGMRRLSIIDIEGGHQPISSEDGALQIVLNGEIYNYRDLRKDLLERGHVFKTRSDTEVILHLYEDLGPACLDRLRGMFAVAIWDARKEAFFLARDRLGIKPLYFFSKGGLLVFASEMKALLVHPEVPRQLDLEALDQYITYLYIPSPRAIFQGIRKLPPGCRLLWTRDHCRVERYWDLRFGDPAPACGIDEAAEELRAVLLESVRAHLVADVPVGALLSGGIDSSAVVALLAQAGQKPKTFSIGFGERNFDELGYAREVARMYGTDHHEEVVQPDAAQVLPALAWHLDEPFADASAVPTFAVASMARKHLKVVLSGDGGDELFAGYGWLRQSRAAEILSRLPRGLRLALAGSVRGFGRGGSLLEKVGRVALDSLASPEQGFIRRVSSWTEALKQRCYGPDLARAGARSHEELLSILADPSVPDFGSRMLLADTKRYLPDDCLAKVDRMSMAWGLESRVPFADHVAAEFAARLPFEWKLRGLTTKFILKRAVGPLLPAITTRQRKQGFSIPVNSWLRGPLGGHAARLLRSQRFLSRGLFLGEGIESLLRVHLEGREDLGQQIWNLLCLEVWCRIYLDGPLPDSAPRSSLADLE